ncbi:MAG TPA: choice-of-anchor tandem repeat GloVer-containing protein, partial [Puia sp.]|nr:choice-of-anchor tandem repeat GloVer-containing protein [Puia sp.]
MRKIFTLIVCVLVFIVCTNAQLNLYGLTHNGGANGTGTILNYQSLTGNAVAAKSFDPIALANPRYASLIQASDGNLYGMTNAGGNNGYGGIFTWNPTSLTYVILYNFDYTHGANPYGSLVQGSDGNIYGTASSGGTNGAGVIFSWNPTASTYTVLYNFDNTTGASPLSSLIQASDGNLYGMAYDGGANGYGVFFSWSPTASTYTDLYNFDNTNGANPYGGLVQASDGNLYGMTTLGGSGNGVIFSWNLTGSSYTLLENFASNKAGDFPSGSLLKATDGNLYGMTNEGGANGYGVIFSWNPSSSIYQVIFNFDNAKGGNPINNGLIQAKDGSFYGMAASGGSNGYGVIFSWNPSTSTYTVLYNFDNTHGGYPYGSLIQASDGNLYGTATDGGTSGYGVIFSWNPSTSTYTVLYNFDNTNGAIPYGSLIQTSDGNLYGMTSQGGSNNYYGVIFSINPTTSVFNVLYNFDNTHGGFPNGSLIQGTDGNLYGMTDGSTSGYGVIFSINPSTPVYNVLYYFDGINGGSPTGSMIQASDGNLYGATTYGGNNGYGVLFNWNPLSSSYNKIADLNQTTGGNPQYNALTEVQAQPTISSFSPTSGPVGTLVTINGTNLSNQTTINIGGVAAIPISNNGAQLVAMVMPGATSGSVQVGNIA